MSTPCDLSPCMKGGGFYNRNSRLQANSNAQAADLIARAAQLVPLPPGGCGTLFVAEFGSSQGANSVAPVLRLCDALEARLEVGANGAPLQQQPAAAASAPPLLHLHVTHDDLPQNDFGSLHQLLADPKQGYIGRAGRLSLTTASMGRSFYEPLFPPAHLSLGFSFVAMHWISGAPTPLSSAVKVCSSLATAEERRLWHERAETDLTRFLTLRGREFVAGGLFVASFPVGGAEDSDDYVDGVWFIDVLETVWQQLLAEGAVSRQEAAAMSTVPAYPNRSLASVRASIAASGAWDTLALELRTNRHPAYDDYAAGRINAAQLAQVYEHTWRAIVEPAWAARLVSAGRSAEAAQALLDAYFARLAAAMEAQPRPMDQPYVYMLLQRRGRQ